MSNTPSSNMPPAAKRHKRNPEDDLICPITQQLPTDPVIAMDGRIYERSAIERYFRGKSDANVKSPFTNKLMGKQLLPAPHIKSHVETLVENNMIDDADLVSSWNEDIQERKDIEECLKSANSGDVEAMQKVAEGYQYGTHGLDVNLELAYSWHEKAHQGGNIASTASLGQMLAEGKGVPKNEKKGIMYLSMASAGGSRWGAFFLGLWLVEGRHGLPVDLEEARRLVRKSLTNTDGVDDMDDNLRVFAQELLSMLEPASVHGSDDNETNHDDN